MQGLQGDAVSSWQVEAVCSRHLLPTFARVTQQAAHHAAAWRTAPTITLCLFEGQQTQPASEQSRSAPPTSLNQLLGHVLGTAAAAQRRPAGRHSVQSARLRLPRAVHISGGGGHHAQSTGAVFARCAKVGSAQPEGGQ